MVLTHRLDGYNIHNMRILSRRGTRSRFATSASPPWPTVSALAPAPPHLPRPLLLVEEVVPVAEVVAVAVMEQEEQEAEAEEEAGCLLGQRSGWRLRSCRTQSSRRRRCGKRICLRHFTLTLLILPSQARDKHDHFTKPGSGQT
eukprot:COSAG06_NODE_1923_length_8061_cov_15.756091_4_plen_144_part_00